MRKHQETKEGKRSSKLITFILLALFFAIALFIRVYFPYGKVFSGDWVKFTGNDAYFHMRLIDNLVHNFPNLTAFDPYLLYPGGQEVGSIRFFDWLLATITWALGLGSPTERTIDVVGAYFPAILGALTVIPVYFIGKELFGRWVGWLSAGLISVLGGEFLGRSLLGFTDHHVAETLFTTIVVLFLILALKTASQRQWTFNHLWRRDWVVSARPVIYSLLAGAFLVMYMLTWQGGLLFVFVISLYFVVQFVADHLRGKSTDYLGLVGGVFFLSVLLVLLIASNALIYLVSAFIALLIPLVLSGVSRFMANKKINVAYYPLTVLGLGLAGLGIFYLINPLLVSSMLSSFSVFRPSSISLTTIEMQPIFRPWADRPLALVWGNFTTSFFLAAIVLAYFIVRFKKLAPENTLLVVWSLVILGATLAQRRFAYYLSINVALLSAYLCWQGLRLAGVKESTGEAAGAAKGTKDKRVRTADSLSHTIELFNKSLAVLIVFLIAFLPNLVPIFPNIATSIQTAQDAPFAPSDAWVSSLSWLKDNSPDPFGDPDFYYRLEESRQYQSLALLKRLFPNPTGDPDFYYQLPGSYKYPESAYGVLAWWDYGYWITRIAHRIPNANPSQEPGAITSVAGFFTSQDENSAAKTRQELGASYVIIDSETATSKFWAVATWAGKSQTDFLDVYLVPQEDKLVAAFLYYPEYYRSMASRLYNFDGNAVSPTSTLVISYEERPDKNGNIYKIVTSAKTFANYEEAEAYRLSQQSGTYRIVGTDPFISPVPLEALERYRLVHNSENDIVFQSVGAVSEVKIFEYVQ